MPVEYSPFWTDEGRLADPAGRVGWRVPCCGVSEGAPKALPLARDAPQCPPTAGRLAFLRRNERDGRRPASRNEAGALHCR
jgi:hypothetical protein